MERGQYAPKDLDERGRRLWSSVQRALRDQGTWQASDAGALDRYVRAVIRALDARQVVDRDGLIAEGGRGQPIAHPALRIARDAERDAAEYARDLLLTPRSRRIAGISETTALDDELADLLER